MTEKQKKLLYKQIKKSLFIVVFSFLVVLLILWFIVPLFSDYSDPPISSRISVLLRQLDSNKSDEMLQKEFIKEVIQEQEGITDVKKKNKSILERAIQLAMQYLKQNNTLDIRLALARLYYQMASVVNAEGNVLKASLQVNKGNKEFAVLIKKHADNFVVRMFRAINFSSIPTFFGKEKVALEDFLYVSDRVLADSFTIEQELKDMYYRNTLYYCFELAIKYVKDHTSDKEVIGKITRAYKKVQSWF